MRPINWGLIGCGDVARKRVARAIQQEPRSRLTAASRRDPTKLREFCEAFSIERSYTEADELIAAPDIDAVYIATPVRQHLPQAIVAAQAGKHVLVEKPMAMTVTECDRMIAACRDAGVRLGVAYYRRFYPLVHRIRELVEQGAIGTPMAVSAVTSTALAMQPGEEGYWRAILEEGGGGALMDVGSHRIDLFLHLFGDVSTVKCFCGTIAASYEAEDTAALVVKFASGVMGTLQCHFGTCIDPDQFAILGTEGRLSAQPLNREELVIETRRGRETEKHPPATNLGTPLIEDFVSAIREDREPAVSGAEGRRTNEVMQRAYADAASTPGSA